MKIKAFSLAMWCMILILIACASNNSLEKKLQLFQTPPGYQYPIDSTGYSEIKSSIFFTKNSNAEVFTMNSNNLYLVDFNNDGEKDVIYQDNRHYQTTMLLVKKGNDFVEIWKRPGRLVDVKQGKKTTFFVLNNAIGCLNEATLSELMIKNDTVIVENILTLHVDTKLNNINKTLKRQRVSGVLRTQAVVDDTKKKDPCTGDVKIGNQLRTIEDKEVTVIKNQDEWLLVVFKEVDRSMIGWVKI